MLKIKEYRQRQLRSELDQRRKLKLQLKKENKLFCKKCGLNEGQNWRGFPINISLKLGVNKPLCPNCMQGWRRNYNREAPEHTKPTDRDESKGIGGPKPASYTWDPDLAYMDEISQFSSLISYRQIKHSNAISYRQSDFQDFIKEDNLEGYDLTHISDNPAIKDTILEAARDFYEEIEGEFEFYQGFDEAVSDWDDGPGYASISDGGYEVAGYSMLSSYVGGGFRTGNEKLNEAIDAAESESYETALNQFKEEYEEEIKGIPEDKLNYHDLYDMGKGDLAESLSETEHDAQDELISVKFRVGFKSPKRMAENHSSPDGKEYPGVYLFFDIDGPNNYNDWWDESYIFKSLSELKSILNSRFKVFKDKYIERKEISSRRIGI